MAIRLKCKCGQAMQVEENMAGRTGKCPKCGTAMKIPSVEEIQEFKRKSSIDPESGGSRRETTVAGGQTRSKTRAPKRRSTKRLARAGKDDPDREKTRLRRPKTGIGQKKGKKTAVITKTGLRKKTGKLAKEPGSTRMGVRSSQRDSQATSGRMSAKYMQPKKKYWIPVLIGIGGVAFIGMVYWIIYSSISSHASRLVRYNKYVATTQAFRTEAAQFAGKFVKSPPVFKDYDNEDVGPRRILEDAWGIIEINYEREGYSEFGDDEDEYDSYTELEEIKELFIGETMQGYIRQYTRMVARSNPDKRRLTESRNKITDVMLEISSRLKELGTELGNQFYRYDG